MILGGTGKLWLLICLKFHSTELCALRLRADETDDIFIYLFILSFICPPIQILFIQHVLGMIGLSFMIESKNITVSRRKHNPCPQGV